MSDTATLAEKLKTQLRHCEGFDGDEISTARAKAFDYYFQRARGDEVVGRSAVVSGDLSSMVEATLATMMEAFDSSRIGEFDPLDAEDETQSQLESDAVSYFLFGRENGWIEVMMAIKEALLLRNCVAKVEAVDKTVRRIKRHGNVEPAALPELLSPDEVVDSDYDEDTRELTLTIQETKREFSVRCVSMENIVYYSQWTRPTLEGIPIVAIRHLDTRAEVLACFPDKKTEIDGLTTHRHDLKTETQARNPKTGWKPAAPVDSSQELVEWYECYVRMDSGSGIDELHRASMSYTDGVILEDVPVPFMRLAGGTAIINPNRFTGISLYDKLKQIQDIETGLTRALLDNVNATTKNRLAGFDGVVNGDDVSDGRVNNLVRVKPKVADIRAALMPLVVPDTSANILANIESFARKRSEMGGAALDMQSAQMQIGGDRMGSEGLDRAYSVAEQLSAAMTKTLAKTFIRDLFLIAHKTLREYFDQPLPVKRDGKWLYVNPSDWPERHSVTIKPGMSAGERTRKVAALDSVINAQLGLAERGMDEVLVGIPEFNRALLDRARLSEVQNPEQYFIDPESDRSQQAAKAKQDQAQALDMQKKALMQNALGLEQLRVAFEKYRTDADREMEYFKAVLSSEVEEAKIVGSATTQLAVRQREGTNKAGTGSGGNGAENEPAVTNGSGQTSG